MPQLHLDLHSKTRVEPVWSFGGNISHAALLHRKDIRKQLQHCRDDLGMKYVRFHGAVSDDLHTIGSDGSYTFTRLEKALDAVMEVGLMPHIVLSGMPKEMVRDQEQASRDGLYAGPPADWTKWYELVKATATMIDGRYGCDAREWFFEISPEASGAGWTGTREEFLKYYDLAAKAIKEVHAEFKVGGPGTMRGDWLDEFLGHVKQPSADYGLELPRCDFVAVAWNNPTGSAAEIAAGREGLAAIRRRVTETLGENVQLLCTGWGGPVGPELGNDPCAAGALLCETASEFAEHVQGMYWTTLTDIDDEAGPRFEPFHGGKGLMTVNNVRKAAFHALRMFGEHKGYHCEKVGQSWVNAVAGLGVWASVEEYTLKLLCWYHRDASATGKGSPVSFTIEGISDSVRTGHVEVIRPGAGSAFEYWAEAGAPPFVTRDVLEEMEVAAHPFMTEVDFREFPPRLEPGMVMQLSIPLPYEQTWSD